MFDRPVRTGPPEGIRTQRRCADAQRVVSLHRPGQRAHSHAARKLRAARRGDTCFRQQEFLRIEDPIGGNRDHSG